MGKIEYNKEQGKLLFGLSLRRIARANPARLNVELLKDRSKTTYDKIYEDLDEEFDHEKFNLVELRNREFPLSDRFILKYSFEKGSEIYEPIAKFRIAGSVDGQSVIYEAGDINPHLLNQTAQRIKHLPGSIELTLTIPREYGIDYNNAELTPEIFRSLEKECLERKIAVMYDNPADLVGNLENTEN